MFSHILNPFPRPQSLVVGVQCEVPSWAHCLCLVSALELWAAPKKRSPSSSVCGSCWSAWTVSTCSLLSDCMQDKTTVVTFWIYKQFSKKKYTQYSLVLRPHPAFLQGESQNETTPSKYYWKLDLLKQWLLALKLELCAIWWSSNVENVVVWDQLKPICFHDTYSLSPPTLQAKAVAHESQAKFFNISASSLTSKWVSVCTCVGGWLCTFGMVRSTWRYWVLGCFLASFPCCCYSLYGWQASSGSWLPRAWWWEWNVGRSRPAGWLLLLDQYSATNSHENAIWA